MHLFKALHNDIGTLSLIAEDLGDITPEVRRLRDETGFPGMSILQFAFDGNPDNGYLPYNISRNTVVYTGTHDNDTTRGWFNHRTHADKQLVLGYLHCDEKAVVETMIRSACESHADLCIVPLQDIFNLDSKHRMNTPGTIGGNWEWRFTNTMLRKGKNRLLLFGRMIQVYGRNML
jgi:4-alpha-glucanotransferase